MRSKEPNVLPASDYYLYQPSTVASKIYLYPVVIGFFYYQAGYLQRRSSYDSFLLLHVVKGACHVSLQGKPHVVAQDQFLLLDCYRPHEYWYTEDSQVSWLHFDGSLARAYYELITASQGNIISTANSHHIERRLEMLLNTFRNAKPIRESDVSSCITEIMTSLLNPRSETGGSVSHGQIVENAIAYINEHFREPLSLETLARNASMSQFHFTRVFSRETGFTPHQYVIAARINYAKFLLKTSAMPVKEIAFHSGFTSESGFCSCFRKREKMTPGEYRDSAYSSPS